MSKKRYHLRVVESSLPPSAKIPRLEIRLQSLLNRIEKSGMSITIRSYLLQELGVETFEEAINQSRLLEVADRINTLLDEIEQ